MMIKKLPIFLTLFRLILSPLLLPLLLFYFLPLDIFWVNVFLVSFFLLLGVTDFFDGYIARNYGEVTKLGKILDPIADKFLISSTVITLVALGKFYFYWAVIIIGREFFIMGLREIGAYYKFSIPVSIYGKAKTFFQITFLAFIIVIPNESSRVGMLNFFETFLLAATLFLTIYSALLYFWGFKKQMQL